MVSASRRDILKLAAFAGTAAALAKFASDRKAIEKLVAKAEGAVDAGEKVVKTICTFCAVGCGTKIVVRGGVPINQYPWFDHPINQGGLCAKGAAMLQQLTSPKRLKYPMKKEGGKWVRITWDQALDEIASKLLEIRDKYGPDAVMWIGSAKINNEAAYLFRKLAAFWGTNNVDHQARICHSTTVAGLGNTWGYGAQTNHVNDIQNSKCILIIGSNTAECHPVAVRHILAARDKNGAIIIVADPRFTRTAAIADEYVRFRSGTDIALILGLIHIILANGWEDKEFLETRTYGLEYLKEVVKDYTPEVVEDITGVPKEQLERVARLLAENRPGTIVYSMGSTQHSAGTQVIRSYALLQLVLGNAGKPGGGVNALRGHDNVQGATDVCILSHSLPGYYGLKEKAWKHWCSVWGVDYEWMLGRFASKELMEKPGFTVARWFEGVLLPKDQIDQPENIHAVVIWGHSMNSISEMARVKEALEKVDLVVIVDVYPSLAAALPDREDGMYLLPASTQMECSGSVTNSGRQRQWRFKVVDPLYESKPDLQIILELADKLGFGAEFKKYALETYPDDPEEAVEVVAREISYGMLSIGMCQPPERIKGHMEHSYTFDPVTLRANGGPYDGDYWGLPWPCWGVEVNGKFHPGTPILYDVSKSVMDGGHAFRVKWGTTAPDGQSLLAADGVRLPGQDPTIPGGYDQYSKDGILWLFDLTKGVIREALSRGLVPSGNGRARINAWNLPDPVPVHREPIMSPRPDLVERYPTYDDKPSHYRLTTYFKSIQDPTLAEKYPLILTSGRVVEHQGGGGTTRQLWWLVELNPEMYAEINPKTANDYGIRDGDMIWVISPAGHVDRAAGRLIEKKILVKAKVTERVDENTIFLPFHWGGIFMGQSLKDRYPPENVPESLGDSANIITSDGYDVVTQMQETKTGLCRVEKAG